MDAHQELRSAPVSANSLADPANSGPVDEASVYIEASPEAVWDLVSDLPRISEWSPECTGVRWLGSPTGPVVGARFLGFNRQGWKRWFTRNVVEESARGEVFAWLTKDNKTRWAYRLARSGTGTTVTETRTLPAKRPFGPKLAIVLFLGGLKAHDEHMRENMQQTLERLKTLAESADSDGHGGGVDA
jgi:uncharacterized protein YndB with AHSA1/START domain